MLVAMGRVPWNHEKGRIRPTLVKNYSNVKHGRRTFVAVAWIRGRRNKSLPDSVLLLRACQELSGPDKKDGKTNP